MAAFDVVVNNADRKGGHVLHATDGNVYGVDHGICLHTENKLRTVLWGFIGERLPEEAIEALEKLRTELHGGLADDLNDHITRREVRAVINRTHALLADPVYPEPNGEWRAVPWPAF
jgi:uncharacterized repeat protein (TIGR03843 family)